jgi:hypothetical protein
MTNFAYTQGIPATNDNPSDDQPPMLINNDNNFLIWNVDHIGFNQNNGGFHTILHQPFQTINSQAAWNPVISSGVPAAIAATAITGVQQTFSMNYTPAYAFAPTDTQLFSMTGAGGISQLTGNSALAVGGWQWIGGTLLIWGTQSIVGGTTVTFTSVSPTTIPFPNSCFVVLATINGTANSTFAIEIVSKSTTDFVWKAMGSVPGGVTGFSWLAIGF